jgi:glyoxylase-like metal-dependent hydrolase (beta-lactamase superfamily II)
MYGDIIEIAQNTLFIEGKIPSTIMKEPDIANAVVYKADDTVYLLDTGATAFFRERLHEAIEQLKPFKRFILLNSHEHPDHTGNNSIIKEIYAETKEHYISQKGIAGLDVEQDFYRKLKSIREYYDYIDGPTRFPFTLMRLLKLTRIMGDDIPLRIIIPRVLKKFMPIEPSIETAIPFEKNDPVELPIGSTNWTGWNLNNHVYAMEARGHSPSEIVFYLPKVKTLFLADETFEFFNCWPDSSAKAVKEVLNKAIAMFKGGHAEILVSGHTHKVLKGNNAIEFLNTLLKEYEEFTETVLKIVKSSSNGLTVNEIYNKLKELRGIPVIKKYLSIEFPKMPPFLKTVITSLLLNKVVSLRGKQAENALFVISLY